MHIQGLEEVPDITSLEAAEDLFTCLTLSKVAISSTIIREEMGARLPVFHSYLYSTVQKLSSMLLKIQKLTLAIVVATQKHKFYFQTHAIILMTYYSAQSRRATIKV